MVRFRMTSIVSVMLAVTASVTLTTGTADAATAAHGKPLGNAVRASSQWPALGTQVCGGTGPFVAIALENPLGGVEGYCYDGRGSFTPPHGLHALAIVNQLGHPVSISGITTGIRGFTFCYQSGYAFTVGIGSYYENLTFSNGAVETTKTTCPTGAGGSVGTSEPYTLPFEGSNCGGHGILYRGGMVFGVGYVGDMVNSFYSLFCAEAGKSMEYSNPFSGYSASFISNGSGGQLIVGGDYSNGNPYNACVDNNHVIGAVNTNMTDVLNIATTTNGAACP